MTEYVARFNLEDPAAQLTANYELEEPEEIKAILKIDAAPDVSDFVHKDEFDATVEQLQEEIAQIDVNIEGSGLIDVQRTDDATVISSKTFVFEQAIPSKTWEITHNLNKRPNITLTYYNGEVFEAYREYVNNNQVIIRLENAATGYAYLN